MSPTPTTRASSALQAEINKRLSEDLRALEERTRALEDGVKALEGRLRVDEARSEGARAVRDLEARRIEERLAALEGARREEILTRSGVAWGWGRALLTAIPAIVSLGIGIAVFVRGC